MCSNSSKIVKVISFVHSYNNVKRSRSVGKEPELGPSLSSVKNDLMMIWTLIGQLPWILHLHWITLMTPTCLLNFIRSILLLSCNDCCLQHHHPRYTFCHSMTKPNYSYLSAPPISAFVPSISLCIAIFYRSFCACV